MEIKVYNRKGCHCLLKEFDYLAEDSSYINIVEWTNGDGFDISIDNRQFTLTYGEIEAINYLIKHLEITKIK